MGRLARVAAACAALISLTGCFGNGLYTVGTNTNQIPTGLYTAQGGDDCYWARYFGAPADTNIVGENYEINRTFAEITTTDGWFITRDCGIWDTPQAGPYTNFPNALVESNHDHRVGIDMTAGTWTSSGTGDCAWWRLRNWTWELDDSSIIATGIATGPTTVVIQPTDVGFESYDCGGWYRTGDVPG